MRALVLSERTMDITVTRDSPSGVCQHASALAFSDCVVTALPCKRGCQGNRALAFMTMV